MFNYKYIQISEKFQEKLNLVSINISTFVSNHISKKLD